MVEDGRETASYDVGSGHLTLRLPKATHGEHFPNLSLLTGLLTKPTMSTENSSRTKEQRRGPLIAELDPISETVDEETLLEDINFVTEETEESSIYIGSASVTYGFNDLYNGVFIGFNEMESILDMLEVGDPEKNLVTMSVSERQRKQETMEDLKFDPDYYATDLVDDEAVQAALRYEHWFSSGIGTLVMGMSAMGLGGSDGSQKPVEFSQDEKDIMTSLPRRTCKRSQFFNPCSFYCLFLKLLS